MRTMNTLALSISLALAGCVAEVGDDESSLEETEIIESEVTATLSCTGYGSGTCTASATPSWWSIAFVSLEGRKPGFLARKSITATGPTTASWTCRYYSGYAKITAGGVAVAYVRCAP